MEKGKRRKGRKEDRGRKKVGVGIRRGGCQR